jgi:hypothetical protein
VVSPRSKAGDPAVTRPKGCTACEMDCTALFTCVLCGLLKPVCWNRVGGFEASRDICSACLHEVRLKEIRSQKRRERRIAAKVLQANKGIG